MSLVELLGSGLGRSSWFGPSQAQQRWLLGVAAPPDLLQQQAMMAQAMMAYDLHFYAQRTQSQSLADRQLRADLAFRAKGFSQHWLDAMLDVELGP